MRLIKQTMMHIKLFVFDGIRPHCNLYNFFINMFPNKKNMPLNFFGTLMGTNATVTGSVKLYEPAWLQINSNSHVHNIKINGQSCCVIESGLNLEDIVVEEDTIFTSEKNLKGKELQKKYVTLSLDLEAGVGLSHADEKEFSKLKPLWNSKESAKRLKDLFSKYDIPTTWAVCGHLFLEQCNGKHPFQEKDWYGDWFKYDPATNYKQNQDWYMPDFIQELMDNDLFEVGYHSFGHFKYRQASAETIKKDLESAQWIRDEFKINLCSFVYPYNGVEKVVLVANSGFKNIRGYLGQYYASKTIQFDGFKFFVTSQCLTPDSIKNCIKNVETIKGKNFNYFTHPFNWRKEKDFELMEEFLKRLSDLQKQGYIEIRKMEDVG